MKIIKFLFLSFFLFLSVTLSAQKEKGGSFMDDVYWGGDFGLSFGSYTYIRIAPVLYYEVFEDMYIGAGVEYTYYKDIRNPMYTVEGSVWSPRILSRYFVFDDVFIHAEYQRIYYKDRYSRVNPDGWVFEDGLYAGGGYRQWMGNSNSYMFIMLLFDLRESDINFGINPRIQMGFAASF